MPISTLRHLLLALFLLTLGSGTLCAQERGSKAIADTLEIRFRVDSTRIDMGFDGNWQRWSAFEERFRQRYRDVPPAALRLDIFSGASPEGTAAANQRLGQGRGDAISRLVRQRLGQAIGNIYVHNEGARWDALRTSLAASNEPWRDEALAIIDEPPGANPAQRDPRETRLRALRGGTVWPVLLERYLAPLRSGASATLSWETGAARRDTIVIRETIVHRDTVVIVNNIVSDRRDTIRRDTVRAKHVIRRPAWLLRTNLPLWGVLSPNLQAEWSLDHRDRWSINLEVVASWWTFARNAYANQLVYGSAEIRYWLGKRSRHHTLDGFHIGLAAGGGYYDFEWKSKGYQGEIAMAFVNIGWQRRFGKRRQWAFDAGIGLGYLYSPYRRYLGSTLYPESHTERYDDHLMWQHNSRLNWFGAPHANISIAYVFMPRKGIYRRAKALERQAEQDAYEQWRDSIMERERQMRDSLYIRLYDLPKAERKAAINAFRQQQKQRLQRLAK